MQDLSLKGHYYCTIAYNFNQWLANATACPKIVAARKLLDPTLTFGALSQAKIKHLQEGKGLRHLMVLGQAKFKNREPISLLN